MGTDGEYSGYRDHDDVWNAYKRKDPHLKRMGMETLTNLIADSIIIFSTQRNKNFRKSQVNEERLLDTSGKIADTLKENHVNLLDEDLVTDFDGPNQEEFKDICGY